MLIQYEEQFIEFKVEIFNIKNKGMSIGYNTIGTLEGLKYK